MTAKKKRTIFSLLLVPLLGMMVLESAFLLALPTAAGVVKGLDKNATDMFAQKVESRGKYITDEMIGNWSNLNMMSDSINSAVQSRLDSGKMKLTDLDSNSVNCVELLNEISPELISTMYNKQVSGIYVIFNIHGLGGANAPNRLTGVYLRDNDPTAVPSKANSDILIERAPVGFVKSSQLATDTGWQPAFAKEDSFGQSFFYNSYFAAYSAGEEKLPASDYGYWTVEPYKLSNDSRNAIAYSVPLILEDGTLYGVLGIELLTSYIQGLLPGSELLVKDKGAYILATGTDHGGNLKIVTCSVDGLNAQMLDSVMLSLVDSDKMIVEADSESLYVQGIEMNLYNANAPFDNDKWYLLGIGDKKQLFALSEHIYTVLQLTSVAVVVVGAICILLVSYRLSRPIMRLSEQVSIAQKEGKFPVLSATNIREIDSFSSAIMNLENEVAETSTRFKNILDMASIDIAVYEVDEEKNTLFVTDNYFNMFEIDIKDTDTLTLEQFLDIRREISEAMFFSENEDGSCVYRVELQAGGERYLRSEVQIDQQKIVGLVEDVTAAVQERIRIERERDFDILTNLYSRWGFRRHVDSLIESGEDLKTAALLMLDLDDLKRTNDEFGHEIGDLYIKKAGEIFLHAFEGNSICARVAGDEFLVLLYNYDSKDVLRSKVQELCNNLRETVFELPNGMSMCMSASGGIAWYGEDSSKMAELMTCADFAMYEAKHKKKGTFFEFDEEEYKKKLHKNQCSMEFYQLIREKEVNYHYQPIFNGKDGLVYAYEALMRVNFPALRSPDMVMKIAKETNKLSEVESITMFKSVEKYQNLLERGQVSEDALLFVNSIANVCLSEEESKEFHEKYSWIQPKIVFEITESEQMDMDMVKRKADMEGFSGMFALDDYGSGYNSEINLIELNPKFVKVDITIVRDIDKGPDKQQIVKNIVEYAHNRDMLVLAEGIETAEELNKILELEVDLLQGYFLAKPGEIPPQISEGAMNTIECFYKN